MRGRRAARFADGRADTRQEEHQEIDGEAAEAVLQKHGLWEDIRPHLVLGDTIAQAAQFATTGNAIGGLLAYSLVLAPGFAERGTYVLIPESDHLPLRQRMVLLKRAGATATQFYAYLQGNTARAIFRKHGFGAPQAEPR